MENKNMWLAYALIAAVIWGLNYTLEERVFKFQISPLTLLAGQAWLAAFLFTGLACIFNLKRDVVTLITHRADALYLFLIAVVVAAAGNFFIAISIQAKNATFAALIEESYPLFTVLFTFLLFKENYLTPGVIMGGALIIAGVVIITVY